MGPIGKRLVAIRQGVMVLNLKENRFRLDIRRTFFTTRVVKHWNKVPREVVDVTSPETFKVRLDRSLSNLI